MHCPVPLLGGAMTQTEGGHSIIGGPQKKDSQQIFTNNKSHHYQKRGSVKVVQILTKSSI